MAYFEEIWEPKSSHNKEFGVRGLGKTLSGSYL